MVSNERGLLGPYAVVRSGGKQYTVEPGQKILVDELQAKPGEQVVLSNVLLLKTSDEPAGAVLVGNPYVSGVQVMARVVAQRKEKKILTFKKRRRHGYTKWQGHRQSKTEILIEQFETV